VDKRIIVPAFFGVLVLAVSAAYASIFLWLPLPFLVKGIVCVGIAALAVAMAYVIVQRNRELKKEDERDFNDY